MKKSRFLYLLLLLLCGAVSAQEVDPSDSVYHARCRYLRESLIETGREFKAQTKAHDCAETDAFISETLAAMDSAKTPEAKNHSMLWLGKVSCPRVIAILEQIILSDSSEFLRTQAMQYLGWIDAQSSVPFLLDYYRDTPNLSVYEQVRIGTTLIVLEVWDEAEKIINRHCYDTSASIVSDCQFCYQVLGNLSSVKYFRHMNKLFGGEMIYIWDLVNLGDKETALAAIRSSLKKKGADKMHELELLEMIGDKESIDLIRSAMSDLQEEVRKDAEIVLKRMNDNAKKE